MNDLEYQLMEKAHFNYGNIVFAMQGFVLDIEREVTKGDISAASNALSDVVDRYTILESNYRKIDVSKYDEEHGGLIMKEVKEQKLPELNQLIEDFKSTSEQLQSLKECVNGLSLLGRKFAWLPKYRQYRAERIERKKRSGAN